MRKNKYFDDYEEDDYIENRFSKRKNEDRRKAKKLKNALKTKNIDALRDIDDDDDE